MTAQSVCAVIVAYHTSAEMLENIPQVLGQVRAMVVVDNESNADELDPLRVASSLALISLWWSASRTTLSSQLTALWSLSTLALAWFVALSKIERNDLIHLLQRHLLPLAIRG